MRRKWTSPIVLFVILHCSQVLSAQSNRRLPTAKAGPKPARKGILAELDGIVAVIPAGGPHNEMAMRASRHWRKVRVS